MHWESYYFPAAGFAITRGWYRQADALHNQELYDRSLDTGAYSSWLRRMGVRYVFVPHAPLVADARREAVILAGSNELTVVYRGADWTVYRLRRSQPLVVPLASASASVLAMDHTSMTLALTRPGPYLVKLTWSPFWQVARRPDDPAQRGRDSRRDGYWQDQELARGRSLLHEDSYGFMVFSAPAAGVYELRFDLAKTAEAELQQ